MSDLYINARLTIAGNEFEFLHARSSGPGGQNVNKVNTKVTLRWSPSQCEAFPEAWRNRFVKRFQNRINREGQVVLHSERYRDRPRNIEDARQKLADMLRETQSAPKKRKPTKPTRGSQRRRMDNKTKQSQKKQNRQKNIRHD
ncbi:alternative ribosome rescue aminoacyl-tRNA hydrolase ArfB [Planctomycetes bacterium K23_9]|uniref:Peptidyl-tRNA hydrolase ArfB n=1 Tax=Stieleria marina TaxID=1930275 RepID=A0A517NYH0_9BACT|nr:Peptidyl-tRNA hydrolase ArfB [Planctomycetes bacterium K23_9]